MKTWPSESKPARIVALTGLLLLYGASFLFQVKGAPVNRGVGSEVMKSALSITVLVYDQAQVPDKTRIRAQNKAARIFEQAGIETKWVDCTSWLTEGVGPPACDPRGQPSRLFVHILPKSTMKQAYVLGYAALDPRRRFPTHAGVFYDRVLSCARRTSCYPPSILALAMTHEIGHLLLGTDSHSPTGLMRARWDRVESICPDRGLLRFTRGEAGRMRADVMTRKEASSVALKRGVR